MRKYIKPEVEYRNLFSEDVLYASSPDVDVNDGGDNIIDNSVFI